MPKDNAKVASKRYDLCIVLEICSKLFVCVSARVFAIVCGCVHARVYVCSSVVAVALTWNN